LAFEAQKSLCTTLSNDRIRLRVGVVKFRGEIDVKLILKIALVGAFFCGTVGQGSTTHPYLLTFDEFMSLNSPQKIAYIETLRDALLRGERAQRKEGVKYQAQNQVPHFPNLEGIFYSEALAEDSKLCIYAANISNRVGNYCHIMTGGPCTDPKYPSQCEHFLFGENVCVAVPTEKYTPNQATQACFDKVFPAGYEKMSKAEIAAIDKKIVAGIENTEANRKAWEEFKNNLTGYCGQTDEHAWKNLHQQELCNRLMDRRDDMKDALEKKFAGVTGEAPTPQVAPDLPINGGCDYLVDLKNPDREHTYHIEYSLDHGQFNVKNLAPGFELFADNTKSNNCQDGMTTLPSSCQMSLRKTTYIEGKKVIQQFSLTGANAAGKTPGKTSCTVEHYGEDIEGGNGLDPNDIVDCNNADVGAKTQLFCVGTHEGIHKAVIFVEGGRNGINGVRVCEATNDDGNQLPDPPWVANKKSTSALDRKINSTALTFAKDSGSWWKLGLGQKTIDMTFNDGTRLHIKRHPPKESIKMNNNVQECDFFDGASTGGKDPTGKSTYYSITNLYWGDGTAKGSNKAPQTDH
jgi:hypothetical protein